MDDRISGLDSYGRYKVVSTCYAISQINDYLQRTIHKKVPLISLQYKCRPGLPVFVAFNESLDSLNRKIQSVVEESY